MYALPHALPQCYPEIGHVAAGFQPAFKFQQRIVLVVERGLEARGYAQKIRA
jgi:hypothetical protein